MRRALESVKEFAEIMVIDGSSIDDTRSIASEFGAKIIEQDPQYLEEDGRIKDFAAVRNQGLSATSQPWLFFLDSDEYASPELVEAIRSRTIGKIEGAYLVNRKYVVEGIVIDYATTYPNRSLRLFAIASAEYFRKPVHERIKLKDDVVPGIIDAPLYVPVDLDHRKGERKTDGYIEIEVEQSKSVPLGQLMRGTARTIAVSGLYLARLARIYLFCRGTKMPLEDELLRHKYNFKLVTLQWKARLSGK